MKNNINRHIIIRAVIALVWIIIGIMRLAARDMSSGLISIVVGIAFAASAFTMINKK